MVTAPILKGYDSLKALLMTNETIRKIAFLMLGRIQEKLGSGCTKLFPGETFNSSSSLTFNGLLNTTRLIVKLHIYTVFAFPHTSGVLRM